jgi:curved DNA-binding protein CbpA
MAAGSADDPYALLGIEPDADDTELRRAWRELALRWHPDRAGPDTTAIFQKLTAAYAVLSDPASRAAYDRERNPPPTRRAPSVLIHRLSRPIDALLALGIARHVRAGLVELGVERAEVEEGGMVTIAMRVPVRAGDGTITDELFSAWLAIRPGVTDGATITPSAQLPGVVHPVAFRIRIR